jgi:hypothetical protein
VGAATPSLQTDSRIESSVSVTMSDSAPRPRAWSVALCVLALGNACLGCGPPYVQPLPSAAGTDRAQVKLMWSNSPCLNASWVQIDGRYACGSIPFSGVPDCPLEGGTGPGTSSQRYTTYVTAGHHTFDVNVSCGAQAAQGYDAQALTFEGDFVSGTDYVCAGTSGTCTALAPAATPTATPASAAEAAAPAALAGACELNSDCPAGELCRNGKCRPECREDRDCAAGAHCTADDRGVRRCVPAPSATPAPPPAAPAPPTSPGATVGSPCANNAECPVDLFCSSVTHTCTAPPK